MILNFEFNKNFGIAKNICSKFRYMPFAFAFAKANAKVGLQKRTKVVTRLSSLNTSSLAAWDAETYSFRKENVGVFPPKVERNQRVKLSIPSLGGLKHEEYLLETFKRSNQDTCLTHKPNVIEGSWVQSGDLLTDCASSVGGELSLGQNLLIAYMPWEGYNFEDAILISERLVIDDLYTSIHIERYELEIQKTKLGTEEITRNIPDVSEQEIAHLDSFGVVKLGSWVEEGDILVGKITPINKKKISPYQKLLYSILEKQVRPIKDSSLRAPKGIKAKVIDIKYFLKSVTKTKPSTLAFAKAKATSSISSSIARSQKEKEKVTGSKEKNRASLIASNIQERLLQAKDLRSPVSLGKPAAKQPAASLPAVPALPFVPPLSQRERGGTGLSLAPPFPLGKEGHEGRHGAQGKEVKKKHKKQKERITTSSHPLSHSLIKGVKRRERGGWLITSKSLFWKNRGQTRGKKSFLKKINLLFSKINYSSFNLRFILFSSRFWPSIALLRTSEAAGCFAAGRSPLCPPFPFGKGGAREDDRGPLIGGPRWPAVRSKAIEGLPKGKNDRGLLLAKKPAQAQTSFSKFKLANVMLSRASVPPCPLSPPFSLPKGKPVPLNGHGGARRGTGRQWEARERGSAKADAFAKAKASSIKNIETIHIYLAEKRKIQVGDKMAGRHGNKGIVSQILPIQDMPFLPDGTPIDMVLNPLGVPSRMNVGQIYECLLGFAGKFLGENYKVYSFDEIYGPEASRSFVFNKLYEASTKTGFKWLFDPNSPGKTRLFDGRNGELFDQKVTVGLAYILRLVHMVDDKVHVRSTGPYSLVTQQPLRGRSKQGGQRLGEMEVWAIEGYGAAFTLLEMLTIKSDDMTGRMTLWSNLILNKDISIGTPESFKVLICELQALCLDIGLYRSESRYTETYNKKGNLKLREIQNLMNLP